ncbi:hypothetical protein KFE25_013863 [Diacronema lutheri]|uniref:Splicing factor 3B subunit 1 n=3 Tax=Diacronema lutheri TaxID=2081491 RepID=A0A8J6C6D1_DIALT|nr:hypothetical protein KFE25_013863 [Diacronema lutheri]
MADTGVDDEIARARAERAKQAFGVADDEDDFYGGGGGGAAAAAMRGAELPADGDDDDDERAGGARSARPTFTAPRQVLDDVPLSGADDEASDPFAAHRQLTINERYDEYHKRGRVGRALSPERADAFAQGGASKAQGVEVRTYRDTLLEAQLAREADELRRAAAQKAEEAAAVAAGATGAAAPAPRKRRRWDVVSDAAAAAAPSLGPEWEAPERPRAGSAAPSALGGAQWDATPAPGACAPGGGGGGGGAQPSWDATPLAGAAGAASARASKWDATPTPGRAPVADAGAGAGAAVPGPAWDATPMPSAAAQQAAAHAAQGWDATPLAGAQLAASKWDAAPTPGRAPAAGGLAAAGAGASKWDATPTPGRAPVAGAGGAAASASRWDATPTPGRAPAAGACGAAASASKWDATPTPGGLAPGALLAAASGASKWDATPTPGRAPDAAGGAAASASRWDATPTPGRAPAAGGACGATPVAGGGRSRWDETPLGPAASGAAGGATPLGSACAFGATPAPGAAGLAALYGVTPGAGGVGATPRGPCDAQTPLYAAGGLGAAGASGVPLTPEASQALRWEAEMDARNRPLSDADLDAIFPPSGYKILKPPDSYQPIRTPARKLAATPLAGTGSGSAGLFAADGATGLSGASAAAAYGLPPGADEVAAAAGLPFSKPEDYQHFGKLLRTEDEELLTADELRERRIMKLLLRIKNGTPPQRKAALRTISEKAREFGAGPLFNQLLPLLMSPTLEDQERHLLVKVVDRVLYRLDELVRPYVHKVLVVIEPLLIDEDYYARVEGRSIISNLAKAAGLATMIATMRPDIDNVDEYVRNTTARALSVVAAALGVPALLPFLRAVCASKKSWHARHTGVKVVQQIAILLGCSVLPHLRALVECIEAGLNDEQPKVRTVVALAIGALAEAAAPYGIEAFDCVLKPLWKGIRQQRGKGLAAFLKAIGFIIPLMDAEYAGYYTKEVMVVLLREFGTPDDELKKIVLKVVKQTVTTEGVTPEYVRTEIVPEYFAKLWQRRMAADRRNYRQLVETTVELAAKVGAAEVLARIVDDLKDESEPYRKLCVETAMLILQRLSAADVDARLEEQLVDGLIYVFQEQTAQADEGEEERRDSSSAIVLSAFGSIIAQLGLRAKPYLPQIAGTVKWRLNNRAAKVRQQAADLVARIAPVMKACDAEGLLGHLGVVLYEYLGEEYPDVLGSILGGLKAIVNVIGMHKMTPPVKDLLPRLTPILKNRHEKVQENAIDLVGRIADRGAEFVSAREWMRICFELLELLKAHKKGIRRATVNTFGYIAKAIGPQDVLATLLNNLKVQERQNRVCTTVAIAIVAESCAPFTVVPGLMNEYRIPELNVQNGVLKSFSFLFEYIGEMGRDYLHAVVPLLEDALIDRDLVHRQTACTTVKHLALGAAGLGCEDGCRHLLNHVWPNIFETSPHVVNAVSEAIEGIRVACGASLILSYLLAGLFHPARRVRDVYWRLYNSAYVGAQEALVCAYPILPDEDETPHAARDALAALPPNVPPHGVPNGDARANGKTVKARPAARRRYARTHLELFC